MAYGRGVLCFVFLFISLLIYRIGSVLPSSPFQVSVLSNVGDGSGDAFVSRINENVERYGAGFQNTSAVAETYARVEFAPVKRAISDDDWRDAICKGGLLMQLTIGTNEQAQQALDYHKPGTNLFSQFTSSEDLDKNGWQQRELEQADAFQDLAFEVGQSVMEEIGAEPEDVDGATEWRHLGHTDQWNFPGTNAIYKNYYDLIEGFIIAPNNYGPDYMVKSGMAPHNAVIPDLKQWADVVFLQWQQYARGNQDRLANLKYVLRAGVINSETIDLATRAVGRGGIEDWRHANEISTSLDEGKAMMYSPNGRGIAWLLAQHKDALGTKAVRGIKVFKSSPNARDIHMLFRITPA